MSIIKIDDRLDITKKNLQEIQTFISSVLTKEIDYKEKEGTIFMKRSGFNKLASLYGVSLEIIKSRRLEREKGGRLVLTWIFMVKGYIKTELLELKAENVGACSSYEKKIFSRGEHDIMATALTRARNRVIGDLLGLGLSFEETETEVIEEGNWDNLVEITDNKEEKKKGKGLVLE